MCAAARGAKLSGRTGWSASRRCAGGISVKSGIDSRDRLGKWLREAITVCKGVCYCLVNYFK